MNCCICGKEIDEDSEEAITGVPFAGAIVNYCSKKCMDKALGE